LFLPVPSPGLIVIDECHETSYKQEQAPRYHAVPTAAKLAGLCGAKLVLGSATPGLTELMLAQEERIGYQKLSERAGGQPLPEVSLVDLRDKSVFGANRLFSKQLLEALTETLAAGRQGLLFINRRGSASSQICANCGHVTLCPRCQLPLTFHADLMKLICHHCNFRAVPLAICPECGAAELRYLGGGTKRIEEELTRLFPKARIARIDRDSATPQHMAATYKGLQEGSIDFLIGTQMIAKGLDLPMIDTVGVVSADTMLHLPDFNAAERTTAMLVQVAGRAGRSQEPGRVIIQSYTPAHPALQAVKSHNYADFAQTELTERAKLGYPPYRYLLKLMISAATRETCQQKSDELADSLRRRADIQLMGPAPALLETTGGRYHWVLVVKAASRRPLVEIARKAPRGWTADLDPLSLL
jgi:primosomal protein N' (replication factor Y)